MGWVVSHIGFAGVVAVLIIIGILCEYLRRALKTKPKTLGWRLLTVINLIVYALCIVLLVFNILTEIVI
jgi:hypothetical protein